MRELRHEFRGATLMYGIESDNDYFASHEEIMYEGNLPTGMRFRANREEYSLPVTVFGALGRPRIYAALAAIAVAQCAGIDPVTSSQALTGWEPPAGRVRIVPGARGSVIIDDTYNSSPVAALAALDMLKEVKTKRRIAMLGDMLELGKYSKDQHKKIGERAAQVADLLITVGFRSRATGEAALDAGMSESNIREYEMGESARAGEELLREIQEGDVVLVKGSQSIRMEKAVKALMADPMKASELLVRQEEAWDNR
jgi:UDP-N-acetylmuramoyl-tripeptide--D-alanyl-D-alanine ligase